MRYQPHKALCNYDTGPIGAGLEIALLRLVYSGSVRPSPSQAARRRAQGAARAGARPVFGHQLRPASRRLRVESSSPPNSTLSTTAQAPASNARRFVFGSSAAVNTTTLISG